MREMIKMILRGKEKLEAKKFRGCNQGGKKRKAYKGFNEVRNRTKKRI